MKTISCTCGGFVQEGAFVHSETCGRPRQTKTAANPTSSPVTRAYLDAQAIIGGLPDTPRERALFEALQASLQKLYDKGALHAECTERIRDLQDETEKGEQLLLRDRPEPEANLVRIRRIIEDRRREEPIGAVNNNERWETLRKTREATDALEQLVDEVEGWRRLVKEAT